MARAAPGKPKIYSTNSPVKHQVPAVEKWVTVGSASWAKKMFWAPATMVPATSMVPPTAVCQKGR